MRLRGRLAVRLALWATLLIWVALAVAQIPTARVEGMVIQLGSGVPVSGATVTLTAPGTRDGLRATTDDNGRFLIEGVPPGTYALEADGSFLVRARPDFGPSVLNLSAGEALRDVSIRMVPTGVIAGRVLDAEGDPLRNVEVAPMWYWFRPDDGMRRMLTVMPARIIRSDDRGMFRIAGLGPGTYYVRATAPGHGPVFYPGVREPVDAAPLSLGPGMELGGIDLRLPDDEGQVGAITFRLTGVPEVAGNSAPRFLAMLGRKTPGGSEPSPAVPEPLGEGVYRISPALAGDYDVFIQATPPPDPSGEPNRRYVRVPVTHGRDDIDLGTLAVVSGVWIPGRIRVEGSLAEPLDVGSLSLYLSALMTETTLPIQLAARISSETGEFVIPNVPNGRFEVRLGQAPATIYLAEATYGSADVMDGRMVVDASPQARLEVVLSTGAGMIEGLVRTADDDPAVASLVALIPEPRRRGRDLFRSAITDQHGRFSIEGIPPGEYSLYAWDDIPENAFRNAEFMSAYATRGERIVVEGGSRNLVELDMIVSE